MSIASLWNGVAGVKSHTNALTSVADNVANVSTHGYKGTRALFQDVFSKQVGMSAANSNSPNQVGFGSSSFMANQLSASAQERTDNPLDLAINGAGFFVVKKEGGVENFYTRSGSFVVAFDAAADVGYLSNKDGYRVQGYTVDANTGQPNLGALGDIIIPVNDQVGIQSATGEVDIGINLDAEETNTHAQGTAIDPTSSATYDFANAMQIYDAAGDTHNMYCYYAQLDSFTGPVPSDTANTWKAAMFEDQDGTMVANPASPDNVFFMHFDNTGAIVGVSDATAAGGPFSYVSDSTFTAATDTVSDMYAETFTFTGAGAQQLLRTTATVTFGPGQTSSSSVTVDTDTYNIPNALNADQAGANLADQVNAAGGGYYAVHDGAGVVTIYAEAGTTEADVTIGGSNVTADDEITLQQLANIINAGRAASGSVYVNTVGMVDDAYLEVDGTRFYYDDGVAPPPVGAITWQTMGELATAITTNVANVTATYNAALGGGSLYLAYDSVGTAGNAVTLASDLNAGGGSFTLSGATLANGLGATADHDVAASVYTNNDGSVSLGMTRSSDPTQSITISATNTLASDITGVDFNDFTTVAQNPGGTVVDNITMALDFDGVTQNVIFDYDETPYATTQTAGTYDVFYLNQDGYETGYLSSIEIDENGMVTGTYTNGQMQDIAQLALADFNSPDSMARVGDTLWQATEYSGGAKYGVPGQVDNTMALSTLTPGALELSNVDMAAEMVNMINYQRAFQANTKSIQTGDEMLKTAINLKT
jgi:flagellar hook protein FlgE